MLKEKIQWRHSDNLAEYLENDRKENMGIGQSLARYAVVTQPDDGKRIMVWTIHHVVYDGWSEPLVLENIRNVLEGRGIEAPTQMREFVRYVRETDESAMQDFFGDGNCRARSDLNSRAYPHETSCQPRMPWLSVRYSSRQSLDCRSRWRR